MPDDDSGFFTGIRIAIIGLGLMGGSLAMALKGKCAALLGIDSDPATLAAAKNMRLMDALSSSPADLLPQADLVVLATPVNTILQLLADLPDLHPGSALVIDLGSTKARITAAMQSLPERFDPVGGHPMCGKEHGGLLHADARLFQNAPFAFTALPRSSDRSREIAEQLAQAVGARSLWLDAEVHDQWVSATSHMPYLIANALAASVPVECAPLAGSGFRSASRLASTPVGMMNDIFMTNSPNIMASLQRFREQLDAMETLLAREDYATLQSLLMEGAEKHQTILNHLP